MNHRPRERGRAGRVREVLCAPAAEPEATATTPGDGLLRAAESGQYEALVARARLAQPIAMVTPEEREAELRAQGKWTADKPKRKPKPRRKAEPKPPERELTPNEQYIAEHCQWRERGPNDYPPRPQHRVGQCLTEYDPLTGKLIGDGYRRFGDDDW
jgi:hypothetical protein